ncbi:MAG: hypothetical protein IPJ71_15660 [Bdellovibrionales bacterium]|nr:hypothetical protein [Bdellovibrionales bacterium]
MKLLNIRRWFWMTSLIYILVSWQTTWASARCVESLIHSQNDARFREAGLFSQQGESKLCGPLCILESLARLGFYIRASLPQRLIDMITRDFPLWGISDVPENGMMIPHLELTLELVAKQLGRKIMVSGKSYDLSDQDIFESNNPDVIVIAFHNGWGELNNIELANTENQKSGHFSILSNAVKINDEKILATLDDPAFGRISPTLERTNAPMMPIQFPFRMRFQNSGMRASRWTDRDYIRILTYLIIVQKDQN